ncbi:flavodoxin domain-containing protein [Clostridium aminobutyricum]|uniref:Flavodoxin n=1 Tax=Clostridium aminobutyricum TaxID=33953 RepID=A0A939DAL6_CLOAM|nr:flavodoxin domain-containing protein [Clostridium aminobutyricum]MBN7774195.1 flavodoxin [Clostridium aminobutyricum]
MYDFLYELEHKWFKDQVYLEGVILVQINDNANPNKIAVIYNSKSGFTQKYARWIAKAVQADLLIGKKTKAEDLLHYDTIVFGGGLYAGGINGLKLITKNYSNLKDKKIAVFCLGATPVRDEIVEEVRNKNLNVQQQESIQFFMLRGGFNYETLTPFDKILMNLLKLKLKRKKVLTADERGMLRSYTHPVDFTNEKNIEPIIKYINE